MADKKITDLTGATSLADGDYFEIENAGGNSRKVSFANFKSSVGGRVLISKQTPTGTATVSFTSIPATYTHLELFISGRATGAVANADVNAQFNSDTGANYDLEVVQTSGTAAAAGTSSRGGTSAGVALIAGASATANYGGFGRVVLFNYADTNLYKMGNISGAFQSGTAAANVTVREGYINWRSTSAITQIDLTCSSGNYAAGTVMSLYGVY